MTFHLYRHFDADGVLLYIGQSRCAFGRLGGHKRKAQWYDSIVTMKLERFDTLEQVLKAEQKAIARERPRFNVVHARRFEGGRPSVKWSVNTTATASAWRRCASRCAS